MTHVQPCPTHARIGQRVRVTTGPCLGAVGVVANVEYGRTVKVRVRSIRPFEYYPQGLSVEFGAMRRRWRRSTKNAVGAQVAPWRCRGHMRMKTTGRTKPRWRWYGPQAWVFYSQPRRR